MYGETYSKSSIIRATYKERRHTTNEMKGQTQKQHPRKLLPLCFPKERSRLSPHLLTLVCILSPFPFWHFAMGSGYQDALIIRSKFQNLDMASTQSSIKTNHVLWLWTFVLLFLKWGHDRYLLLIFNVISLTYACYLIYRQSALWKHNISSHIG